MAYRTILLVTVTCFIGCSTPPRSLDGGNSGTPDADHDGVPDADGDVVTEDSDPEVDPCPEGWASSFEEPAEVGLGEAFTGVFPECASAARFAVVPAGMTVSVEMTQLPTGTLVSLVEVDETLLASEYIVDGGVTFTFSPLRSGEVRLLLQRPQGRETPEYQGRLDCVDGCDLEATRYPIVLVHGMAGTDSYLGLFDYFFETVPMLTEAGYQVFTPVTPFIGHSEERALILAEQVDEIFDETGAAKLHFIGHSQGGLDIRVLLTGLGYEDRAATATTLATPHLGIRIDVPQFLAGMDFGEDYMQGEFDDLYPSPTSIPLFSWTGRTCGAIEFECQNDLDGEVVHLLFAPTYRLVQSAHSDDAYEGANDGLVPVASGMWGEFLGILPADHADEIGQIAGATQGPHDHRVFFLEEARRLREVEVTEGL